MTKTCFQIYKRSSPILRRSGSLRTVPKFPGRKRDNRYSNASSPITHKLAIPAAALILSMYPANNISAQNDFNTDEVTALYKKTPNFEILHSRVLENWHSIDGDVAPKLTVHFISTDGNEDNIEGIVLEHKTRKDIPATIFLKVKQLRLVNSIDRIGNIEEVRYAAFGDATIVNRGMINQGKDFYIKIDKDSFDYLKQFFDKGVNNGAIDTDVPTVNKKYF